MAQQAQAYERGTQAVIFASAAASGGGNAQIGQAAPANAAIFALPPTVARGQQPTYIAVQIDFTGTVTATEVDLLGSLDGVNFYIIGKFSGLTAGGIFTSGAGETATIDFPVPLRYISAAIPSGTFTTCKVSFVV